MQKGDERVRLGSIHDDVIRITGQSPKTKGKASKIGAKMAERGGFGEKSASIENGLFHAVSRVLIVIRDVGPDVEKYPLGQVA
jgi:hypothetical protein